MCVADTAFRLPFSSCVTGTESPVTVADFQAREEKCLVEGLREGVEEAYEALISRYQQPVYNLVYRLLNDPSDASDVVQDVFFKIFRNISDFRSESSLKTWVYRIAVNEAYNHRRWFVRHRLQEVGLEAGGEGQLSYSEVIADRGRSPFDLAANRQARQLIEEALTELNPVFRTAVVLRDMEDLSYEEIADILQVSLGTVKSRIVRGREALRQKLAGCLEPAESFGWTPQPAE
jgi:RNA polymerase sigma-70 factor (ECF subfamily)